MRDVSICILPAFSIAEFLGDDFPRLNSESIADFLRQIRVGHATKYLYVRHSVIVNSWLCVQIIFDEGLMHQSFVFALSDFQHELVNVKRTHYIRCKLVSPLEAVVIRVFSPYAESLLEILCMCELQYCLWMVEEIKRLKDFQMVVNLKTRYL